jgi:ketosteroid isomerase-like protein
VNRLVTGIASVATAGSAACRSNAPSSIKNHLRGGAFYGRRKQRANDEDVIMDNVQFVKSLYDAFKRGDLETLFANSDPNIEWFSNADPLLIPWGGERKGLSGMKAYFAELAGHVDFEKFEPQEFFAGDDSVTVIVRMITRMKPSGVGNEGEALQLFKIRDGKVTAFRDYGNTHAVVQAYCGGDIHSAAMTPAEQAARLHH